MEEPHEMVVHEVHDYMHVIEEFCDANDDFQAHVTCQSETELSHGVNPLSIEELEELLSVGPFLDGVDASTSLVDTYCRGLVHPSSSSTFEGEHCVKGFFLWVPEKEQEAPTFIPVDLIAPFPS